MFAKMDISNILACYLVACALAVNFRTGITDQFPDFADPTASLLAPAADDDDDVKNPDCDSSSEESEDQSKCSEEDDDAAEPPALPLGAGFLDYPMGIGQPMMGALLDEAGNPIPLDMAFGGGGLKLGAPDLFANTGPGIHGPLGGGMPMNGALHGGMAGADDRSEQNGLTRVITLGGPPRPGGHPNVGFPVPPADLLQGASNSAVPLKTMEIMRDGVPLMVLKDDPLAMQQSGQTGAPVSPPQSNTSSPQDQSNATPQQGNTVGQINTNPTEPNYSIEQQTPSIPESLSPYADSLSSLLLSVVKREKPFPS